MKSLFLTILFLFSFQSLAQTVLFLGDSLTAGYGIKKELSYPYLVGKQINKELSKEVKILNGGISGSTSASAVSRLKWYLRAKPSIILLALGANDGLRGVKLEATKNNLEKVIKMARDNGIHVILAGMLMPPNYGKDYVDGFKKIYDDLKTKYKLDMIPFLLKDVAGIRELNQADGIHPNEKGHQIMANTVKPYLLTALKKDKK
ncbi:arylesterase [Halobacteriovorax sp. GB3]|uniref:arylesterase n=1 Tax=Halobacteriovorax sp. GB3 TaxID=2719615 RepID=UPI00235E2599|nr:arylesterase [Halobacteriovorax sp. GB3]MDD0851792.1 arylesterase [Halobacteriovorax sp. GB3]